MRRDAGRVLATARKGKVRRAERGGADGGESTGGLGGEYFARVVRE